MARVTTLPCPWCEKRHRTRAALYRCVSLGFGELLVELIASPVPVRDFRADSGEVLVAKLREVAASISRDR